MFELAEKIQKYQQLHYKLRESRPGFMVKVVPIVTGCLGGGIKQLQEDIRDFFNEKERFNIANEMQKIISAKLIHSSESYVRTDKVNVLNIATKNC